MALFYDSESNVAAIAGLTIVENTPVEKRLSGVYFYTIGSTFQIDISDIDFLNGDSFPTTQVEVVGSEYGLPAKTLFGTDLISWTNNHDAENASYQDLAWVVSKSNFCSVSLDANISARTIDWANGSYINSADDAIAVDTYTDNSSRIFHDFRAEDDRFTSAWASWDETQDLNSYDDNLGLQCRCSRLMYPTVDYGAFAPSAGSQPDYSSSTGTRTYFFEMYHTGTAHSNGRFMFGDYDITEADITADNFMIEISLDNTNWYNCNENYGGGALNDGDGCRTNIGTVSLTLNNSIEFTLGTGGFTASGTGPSGWGIYVRISWQAAISSKYLGSITEGTWVQGER